VSLVNQMLRDLDERQASALERKGMATQVRALPKEKRFPWASVLPIVVGVAVAAVGTWLAFDTNRQAAPKPIPESPVASIVPSVTALPMPTLVVPMPVEPEAVAPVVATAAPDSLQMDFKLSQVPQRVEPVAPEASASTPAPVSAPAPLARIDKRPLVPVGSSADSEYRKALAAYRQGRPNEAAEGFQSALRLDARHVSARQALLSLLLEQRRWQEAQVVATDGLAQVGAQPGWAMILARLQLEQGQVAEAERTMATYAAQGERSADYLAFHGLLLEKLQRPQEARAAFTKAQELGSLPPELAAAIEQRLR
jgi:MSHA biogenesis protein MshN